MSSTGRLFAARLLALLALLPSCGGRTVEVLPASSSVDAATGEDASTGDVLLVFELPFPVSVSAVEYSVGDGVNALRDQSGVLDLRGAARSAIEIPVHGLLASSIWQVTVTVFQPDGTMVCSVYGSFAVTPGTTTIKTYAAQCETPTVALDATAPPPPPPSPPVPAARGSVQVNAQLPAGVAFSPVDCKLTSPQGILLDQPVTASGTALDFILQNVPASDGISLYLTATSTDGSEVCRAESTFAVMPDQETATAVLFQCGAAAGDL
jgi:hypothetical protein